MKWMFHIAPNLARHGHVAHDNRPEEKVVIRWLLARLDNSIDERRKILQQEGTLHNKDSPQRCQRNRGVCRRNRLMGTAFSTGRWAYNEQLEETIGRALLILSFIVKNIGDRTLHPVLQRLPRKEASWRS